MQMFSLAMGAEASIEHFVISQLSHEFISVDIRSAWPYKSCNISCLARRGRPIGGLYDGNEAKDCEEAGEKGSGQGGEEDPEAKGRQARKEGRQKGTWESQRQKEAFSGPTEGGS